MINLMYVVLMAMLALNVSSDVLEGFKLVDEGLNRTKVNSTTQNEAIYKELDAAHRAEAAMPDVRRGRLRKLINMKGLVTAMEAHSGITGLIVEKTTVLQDGKTYQFDAFYMKEEKPYKAQISLKNDMEDEPFYVQNVTLA